jgi:DNA-binding beta-propeller fold protein YncE
MKTSKNKKNHSLMKACLAVRQGFSLGFKATILLLIIITIFSCSKDDDMEENLEEERVVIDTTIITINGSSFGTDTSKVQVFFDGKEAKIQSVSDTQIKAMIPEKLQTGKVKVLINNTKLLSTEFTFSNTYTLIIPFAGSTQGFADGQGDNAQFDHPFGVAVDALGYVYVADWSNHKIRKISPYPDREVTTLAGSTQGFSDGFDAKFNNPRGVAVDTYGNVYVADTHNHKIRKIRSDGNVMTLAGSTIGYADGTGTNAKFNSPKDIAVDKYGNIYVADESNHKIRKITLNGKVTTLAGSIAGYVDGEGTKSKFLYPRGIAVDTYGENIYVVEYIGNRIRRISAQGVVSTYAGSEIGFEDGLSSDAKFFNPSGIAVDTKGNVYVADSNNHKIRKIDTKGQVSTFAGSTFGFAYGIAANSKFKYPSAVAVDALGSVYIADSGNHKIRKSAVISGFSH